MHHAGKGAIGKQLIKPFAVSNIALNKGSSCRHHGALGMAQIVVDHHGMAAIQQELGNGAADIASPARNQNLHAFTSLLVLLVQSL